MEVVEVVLLVLAYTVIVLTLFLEIICYKKNIESLATITFTASLLLLIVALTFAFFFEPSQPSSQTSVVTLLAMTLVGLTTPLNILEERRHKINPVVNKLLYVLAVALGIAVIAGYFFGDLTIIQYIVAVFLGVSVMGSMILIRVTRPRVRIAHREKLEQYTAVAFLVIMPVALFMDFYAYQPALTSTLNVGYTLPMLFILLGASKLWDDSQRLSLFKHKKTVTEQDLNNYALTDREKEVVMLLLDGLTYKQIADQLFISMPTVKTHVTHIYRKCKVNNRLELIGLLGQ